MMREESTRSKTVLDPEFLRKLERLALAAKRVQLGVAKGERRSKRKGISVEFADYRDYVQGDDTRFVDWNIYGRLDSLFLKLFQEQEDLTVHLLIDASDSMAFGTPPKLEFACKLAAAIGYVALVGYDRVSVEAFSNARRQRMLPCRGRASAGKLFNFIGSIEPGGETNLERSCRSYVIRNRAKGVAVIMSDFFDPQGFEGCIRGLTQSRSDVYAIHILAPEEIEPELTGDLKLLDCETNAYVEISVSRALMRRYKENRDGFCEAVRRYCRARGIGHFVVPSDADIERLTLEVLRRGGMLR